VAKHHGTIEEHDVLEAEQAYSEFAVGVLLVEARARGAIEECIFAFIGAPSIIAEATALELIAKACPDHDAGALLEELRSLGFLGIVLPRGGVDYSEDPSGQRRARRIAEVHAEKNREAMRLCIHPAFRSFLGISEPTEIDVAAGVLF
jgi:hypothetical protein